jgi:hypothetical protein
MIAIAGGMRGVTSECPFTSSFSLAGGLKKQRFLFITTRQHPDVAEVL